MKKNTSCLLSLILATLSIAATCSMFAAAQAAGTASSEAQAAAELTEKLLRLWADRREYAEVLRPTQQADQPPRLLSTTAPVYPKTLSRAARGTILVSFFVGEDGRVEAARVLESPDPRLNEPTVAAILKWKYAPAMRGDKPVKASVVVPVVR